MNSKNLTEAQIRTLARAAAIRSIIERTRFESVGIITDEVMGSLGLQIEDVKGRNAVQQGINNGLMQVQKSLGELV